ncbi:2-oxoacid dehydrogenases acyltransferase-domain-containing protein [Gamsiella multidivaricata]|uniref:2-oxoacid dehydrogenases acyltransferase-domain-containing protein n=1 Tax=Gamsiella multidivaricata TaxID=101098 RepID=UPI002220A459|nr:2-oxoacid dehydrogenases acyltransferase-domain-containing protein [Gamsiella multidivaricata]KAI7816607.1 2-oxoacid dehydrogenases acyltransferase-domain-containing protein [Gamsiella multidivaricata]
MFAASRSSMNVLRTRIGQSTRISSARMVSGQRLKYSISTKTTAALCSKVIRQQPVFGINHVHRFHASALANAKVPFMLADIGEGITECEVIQWFVKAGDKVEEFDRLCEVQSDKASVEITSRFTGTIATLKYQVGDMAKVGKPLVEIETGDADIAAAEEVTADGPITAGPDAMSDSAPGHAAPEDGLRAHSHVIQDMNAVAAMTDSAPGKAERVETPTAEHILTFATPAVRRVAKENNVDIAQIKGSGKGGRVMKEDVMAYLTNGRQSTATSKAASTPTATTPAKAHIPAGEDKVQPLSMIQKAMFKQMTKSLSIPHFGFADEIILDNATAFRAALNTYVAKSPEKYNFKKVSYMPIFIKALSVALEQYPIMNACIIDGDDASTAKLKYRASHNIGVAMDTPNGLIVPNIKNVQNLSVLEVASELARLQEAGKKNAIPMADLRDGTLSLSNVGMIGGTYLNPVVVTSEVAIAAVGKMQRLPRFKMVEEDGKKVERVVAQQIVNISWSADHRVIDGATVARFSEAWKTVVENPFLLGGMLR